MSLIETELAGTVDIVTSGSYSLTGRTEVGRLSTQFLKGVI